MIEIWAPVPGYEGLYSVSTLGAVRSEPRVVKSKNGVQKKLRGRKLVLRKNRTGYNMVFLSENGHPKIYQVHRLIAAAFIPNPENKPCINHKNGVRNDNRVDNIEWCTASENNRHSFKVLGRKHPMLGAFEDKNPNSKSVVQIFPNGRTKEYCCIVRASKETGINSKCISDACRGRQKTAGGFRWKWK